MPDTVTDAELFAWELWKHWMGGDNLTTTINSTEIHHAADWLIMLAERIKAERATVTMTQNSGSTQ